MSMLGPSAITYSQHLDQLGVFWRLFPLQTEVSLTKAKGATSLWV